MAQRLGYGMNDSGFRPVLQSPDWLWGPLNLIFSRYWDSFPGVIWTKRDVYYTIPPGAEAKNKRNYKSTHPVCFHGADRDNFTYTFTFTFNCQYFY